MPPAFFKNQLAFRKWLERNHDKKSELVVGFHKVNSGKPSMTWPQSVDEALSYGWIDGIRRSINNVSYSIRFTPRKKNSIWSRININKISVLKSKGLLMPPGLSVFENRNPVRSISYSYDREEIKLSKVYERKFKGNKAAWKFFQSQAPFYKRVKSYWIMSAKQLPTQLKRLEKLILESNAGRKI